MAHVRPFSTSTLRDLSNGIKHTFDIYTSRPFQRYKENLKVGCFDLCNQALKSWKSRRIPSSHFWECVTLILTLASKWGCDIIYLSFLKNLMLRKVNIIYIAKSPFCPILVVTRKKKEGEVVNTYNAHLYIYFQNTCY
jgi:hypothetical protein